MNIQGVTRLMDIIAGGDFLGLCDQKVDYHNLAVHMESQMNPVETRKIHFTIILSSIIGGPKL